MTYKELINIKTKTGMYIYAFLPVFLCIAGIIGAAITKNEWFYFLFFFSLFSGIPIKYFFLKKDLKCPKCNESFTKYMESKMVHWNKHTFEWNACPNCAFNLNEEIKNQTF